MHSELTLDYELKLLNSGYDLVIGIDEAGRGPWAGPVSISAYCVSLDTPQIKKVNDSKKVSKKSRKEVFKTLNTKPHKYYNLLIGNLEIDKEGIGHAIHEGIKNLIRQATRDNKGKKIKFLIDGYFKLKLDIDYEFITKGDSKIYSIAAASIIAKEVRDEEMCKLALKFPYYGFERNVGYGTREHRNAIEKYGVCEIHRRSFKPIKDFISS